jgi:transposase
MAKPVDPILIGVDVSKACLAVAQSTSSQVLTLDNERRTIGTWLKTLPQGSSMALEATSHYHRLLARMAHDAGLQVFLLDGFKLSRYRDSIGGRAKTDDSDARLLLRYLTHERDGLTPWTPPPAAYERLQTLLHRRAVLVQTRVTLKQSLGDVPELRSSAASLERRLRQLEALLEKRMRECLRAEEAWDDVMRCQAVEGIGPLTAMALANVFRRGAFRSSDAFIAFTVGARSAGDRAPTPSGLCYCCGVTTFLSAPELPEPP